MWFTEEGTREKKLTKFTPESCQWSDRTDSPSRLQSILAWPWVHLRTGSRSIGYIHNGSGWHNMGALAEDDGLYLFSQRLQAQAVGQGVDDCVEVGHGYGPEKAVRRDLHGVGHAVHGQKHEHDEDGRPHGEKEDDKVDEGMNHLQVTLVPPHTQVQGDILHRHRRNEVNRRCQAFADRSDCRGGCARVARSILQTSRSYLRNGEKIIPLAISRHILVPTHLTGCIHFGFFIFDTMLYWVIASCLYGLCRI